MNKSKYILCSLSMLLFIIKVGIGQQKMELSEFLLIAQGKSADAQSADFNYQIGEADFQIFKASLKPQINLNGQLPNFFQSSSAITQPNGTISFERVSQNNAFLSLSASQAIPMTGGRFFIQSDLQRFDDFSFGNKLYNGVPLRVGFVQPILGFNAFKWRKAIAPLQLKEAKAQYNIDLENTQLLTVSQYFQVLLAAENVNISNLNTQVNEKLIEIADERLELGKISENERLQLEIELESARVNLQQAKFDLEAATNSLRTYLGINQSYQNVEFAIPEPMADFIIDEDMAVREALKNRPEIIAFQRRLKEAEREIAQTKVDNGLQADLFASYGLARGSNNFSDVYTDPFTEQQLSLTISVPLVDWGNRRSSVKRAELIYQDELNRIQQEEKVLENNVRTRVREFKMLQKSVKDQARIKALGEQRFEIANERYILGDISITDWTLAQREKDQSKRNYILALMQYWQAYYQIRLLTGYDFQNNKLITY